MARSYSVTRVVAAGVYVAALSSLVLFGSTLLLMASRGQSQITIAMGRYGEFWIEAAVFVGATVCIPVLLYETDEVLQRQNA